MSLSTFTFQCSSSGSHNTRNMLQYIALRNILVCRSKCIELYSTMSNCNIATYWDIVTALFASRVYWPIDRWSSGSCAGGDQGIWAGPPEAWIPAMEGTFWHGCPGGRRRLWNLSPHRSCHQCQSEIHLIWQLFRIAVSWFSAHTWNIHLLQLPKCTLFLHLLRLYWPSPSCKGEGRWGAYSVFWESMNF